MKNATLCGIGLCLLLAGCHGPKPALRGDTHVVVEGIDAFPLELVGRWKADRHGWEIVFGRDGRITSATLSFGRVEVTPGKTVTVPTHGGGEGTFEPGVWTVYYDAETRQLTVKIVLNHVRVEMAGNVLEGKSTDTFSGPISTDDGVWQTQWAAFTEYKVRTPEGTETDLSTDSTYGETSSLTFQKVSSE